MKHWGPSPLWIMWVHSPNRLQKYEHTKYIYMSCVYWFCNGKYVFSRKGKLRLSNQLDDE